MSKVIFIFILLGLIVSVAFSGEVKMNKARIVAKNFFTEKSKLSPDQFSSVNEYSISFKGETVAFAFNLNNCFVVISAHDAVFPVLAYSFESGYYNQDFPPGFEFWMGHYKKQIKTAIDENRKSTKTIKTIWSRYINEEFYPNELLDEVKPLIYTTWHQGCFYNSYFPAEPSAPCGHLWTGCVATAMGQILKYYNYPKNGSGNYGYNSSYGQVSADFENTNYDWTGMDYHLTGEDSAVAQLLYHCAISIHSQFFPNGTGAYDFDARNAFVNYFNYKSIAQFYWRDTYPGDWKSMLRTELDQGRPVLYGGADSETQAGHTLVCDGYQDTSFFHFNWGWNGYYNGYFYLDSLIAGSNYFNFQHDAVIGIQPNITVPIEIYPPENLVATTEAVNVNLSWTPSVMQSNLELIGYNIFRDGFILNSQIIAGPYFIDANAPPGLHQYRVSSVFIGGEKMMDGYAEVFIEGNGMHDDFVSPLTIFPVPATDHIIIQWEQLHYENVKILVSDLSGEKIFEKEYLNNGLSELKMNLSNMPSGIFIIKIQTGDLTISRKIIVF